MKQKLLTVILAAGEGKRMGNSIPKVLHSICGKPMVHCVLETVLSLAPDKICVVVGKGADKVAESLKQADSNILFATQEKLLGTGDAVKQALRCAGPFQGSVLVVCGDTPFLTRKSLKTLVTSQQKNGCASVLLTANMQNPIGYGRVVLSQTGEVVRIVEDKDATAEEKSIQLVNSGTYCFDYNALYKAVSHLKPENVQKEYYLTDVIEVFVKSGFSVKTVLSEEDEIFGINSQEQLSQANKIARMAILKSILHKGVQILDLESTYVDARVKIAPGTVLLPHTHIYGKSVIGPECRIGPGAYLENALLGPAVHFFFSAASNCKIGKGSCIGPFAHLRPNAKVGQFCKVGNFVELKNTTLGDYTQVNHLTYLGDARLGKNVNVGAGTITCNYDGKRKHKTFIGDGAFVGSDSILVAPVRVGKKAFTAAGSTITKNVPPFALGVGRGTQRNVKDWSRRKFNK